MAEAEEVIQDVAKHATVLARELWRKHRKGRPGDERVTLRDQVQRLDFLLTAVFGRAFPIRVAEPPAPQTFLSKVFRRKEGPAVTRAVPATDGTAIWLPCMAPPNTGLSDTDYFRLTALRLAARAQRRAAGHWQVVSDTALNAYLLILEADACDRFVARTLPGLQGQVQVLRRQSLASRPPLDAFPPYRQGVEAALRGLLQSTVSLEVPTVEDVFAAAVQRSASCGERKGRMLYRDDWTGEFRAPSAAASTLAGPDDGASPTEATTKSARLGRTPKVREAPEEEDDKKSGAWMVQTSQPQEQAEDPIGLQRPTDRDDTTAAEELADSLSELPEARLVSTPGKPKEVLLSEDLPDARSKARFEPPTPASATAFKYPEWDCRAGAYIEDAVTAHVSSMQEGPQAWVDRTLDERKAMLHLVRRRFEMLKAQRLRLRRQPEGDDVDLDAYVEAMADFGAGLPLRQGLYQSTRRTRRDMAILILTDVSGSTDAWVANNKRVVDVEREALLLVAHALQSMREPYALQAFSGQGPGGVVVRELKRFDEPFNEVVSRRIAGLEPEQYTRAGAALRHATATLMGETAHHRLLLLISDGKPNDVDDYEGRYGVEDMRQAIAEARMQGINSFCLTVDRQAANYLPLVFGPHRYGLLPKPELLPTVLLEWMKRLVQA